MDNQEDIFEKLDSLVLRVYGDPSVGKDPVATFSASVAEEQPTEGEARIEFKQMSPCRITTLLTHGTLQVGTSQARVELGKGSVFTLNTLEAVAGTMLTVRPIVARKAGTKDLATAIAEVINLEPKGYAVVIRAKRPLHCIICGGGEMLDMDHKPKGTPKNAYAVQCKNCFAVEFVKR